MSAPAAAPGWGALDFPRGNIVLRNETAIERGFRLKACEKEPWTASWLDAIGPGDLLVNVGANVGSYALIAAYLGAQVLAVDASPINVARLAQNAAANGLGERLAVALGVCGASAMPRTVDLGRCKPGAADVVIDADGPRGVKLPGVTLDDLAEVYGLPTHLLIDVDGGEVEVLRGGAEALQKVRDVMIEISTEPAITRACTALLEAAGLQIVGRWDARNGQRIPDVWYALYRRAMCST